MYGHPALPPDFVSLPYANPDAPHGGRITTGNTGSFDSLNPFVLKGTAPWQLRFMGYESLMGRSYDEPFTLYGLLAESVEVGPNRQWVEFTLRKEAQFSDGSPVTVEDVIWSFDILGREGHPRYRGFAGHTKEITQTGPRSLRITFNTEDRELALIAGLRPILQKAQFADKDFANVTDAPIGSGPYVVSNYELGRRVTLRRNPDYWGKDLPLRRGTNNLDEIRIEFFGDATVLFEAFKAGELTVLREDNAEKWDSQYDFPAVQRGDVIKAEIPHKKPSRITGLVMNTRRAPFDDIAVREALMQAFNFEFINDTLTGGRQPRVTSYFSNSELAMSLGPATGRVRALLAPFADQLPPEVMTGYALPQSDGSARNRKGIRRAMNALENAGWSVEDGRLTKDGKPLSFSILLRQGSGDTRAIVDLYIQALERLGITARIETVDNAQYEARQSSFDFDMTQFRRDLSLSPGNEQRYYWGADAADTEGSPNLMGVKQPAVDAMIDALLTATDRDDFLAAAHALDRILTAGRYVIPFYQFNISRIAHAKALHYPATTPIYGDGVWFMPEVWWYQEE
ncbi:ABC transporter substrate-binding protein [Litorivita pollutaquae]|uniref:ABC transporter substrate-binding protein n=2 Tax=Litorivita pollutaquae TaxID=2200892 RepID=A0A2V4NPG7_9RHOB|nr:ABC transporter substrate-binding protein [Litorivita pollutaquae]